MMKHTISVLVENKFGVLARISGLFSARGYNISSLAVGETEDPAVSRITLVVEAAEERILEQIMKQLRRLIDTISVVDLTHKDYVARELAIVKVRCGEKDKKKLEKIAKTYRAQIASSKKDACILEISADSHEVKAFLDAVKEFGITELARTGRVAVSG